MRITPSAIITQAEEIAKENGWEAHATVDSHDDRRDYDVWAEFAASTHGGTCPDCITQTTGPTFDWIERGEVIGGTGSGQCGGCGGLGMGWVSSGAEMIATFRKDNGEWIRSLDRVAEDFADRMDVEYASQGRTR